MGFRSADIQAIHSIGNFELFLAKGRTIPIYRAAVAGLYHLPWNYPHILLKQTIDTIDHDLNKVLACCQYQFRGLICMSAFLISSQNRMHPF